MTIYKIQIDDQIREATADEAAQIEAAQLEAQARVEALQAKAEAKINALAKLGLSAEEASAILS